MYAEKYKGLRKEIKEDLDKTMVMNWKSKNEDVNNLQSTLLYKFNAISNKIPERFFRHKLILRFI